MCSVNTQIINAWTKMDFVFWDVLSEPIADKVAI